MITDKQRTEEELGGGNRPTASVRAGPIHVLPGLEDEGIVMTGFNPDMRKLVTRAMGWPAATPLRLECRFGSLPPIPVTNCAELAAFASMCIGQGASRLKANPIVTVDLTILEIAGRDSRLTKPPAAKTRPQQMNYKVLRQELALASGGSPSVGGGSPSVGAQEEEEEEHEEGELGSLKVPVWNERLNEVVAFADKGTMLTLCLRRRSLMSKVCAGSTNEDLIANAGKLLLHPAGALCPFKFLDDEQQRPCMQKRHALGASSNLFKLIDKKKGHLVRRHQDAASHRFAERLRVALENPSCNAANLDEAPQAGPMIDAVGAFKQAVRT